MATNFYKALMNSREYKIDQLARKHIKEEFGLESSHPSENLPPYEVLNLPANSTPLTSSLADRLGSDLFAELKGRLPASQEGYLPN